MCAYKNNFTDIFKLLVNQEGIHVNFKYVNTCFNIIGFHYNVWNLFKSNKTILISASEMGQIRDCQNSC